MRDKIKDNLYFIRQVSMLQGSIREIENMISAGKTKPEKVNFMKRIAVCDSINIINSQYSGGIPFFQLKDQLLKAIKLTHECWDGFWKLKFNEKVLNQYTIDAYDQMLCMFSLSYLLDVDSDDIKKIVEVIDRDNIKDYLFEFIIRAKIKDRIPITSESYEYGWKLFGKLRQAIIEPDKLKAQLLVKEFITKDWYKEHKNAAWYNSHKSIHNTYFGYWSFETAAVVKILGLDDSSFKDCIYYPYDLVHYNEKNMNNNNLN